MNIKLQCQDCNRTITINKEKWEEIEDNNPTCKECGGYMEEAEDESEDSENLICLRCKKKINGDYCECENCNEEPICNDCHIEFETGTLFCKQCIDKLYPRDSKIVYKDKIIEKPVYIDAHTSTAINPGNPNTSKNKLSRVF